MEPSLLFSLSAAEQDIFNTISSVGRDLGIPVYAIGGYVRDKLIGRPSKDIDIVCLGDALQLASEVAGRFKPRPNVNYYSRFGTAMIQHNELNIEFVGARKESYKHDSRKPVVFSGTLQDDQLRRDFTINAISISLNAADHGELIDPFNGLEDIRRKRIKTPGNPDATFSDDPLRMLRGVRFAAQLQYTIDPETLKGIERSAARIRIVSRERITAELEKMLMCPVPSIGFDLLFRTGVLPHIFPELVALHGVDYQNGKGHKDNFYHTLQVVDNLAGKSDKLMLRWAALLHDIAKPQTKRYERGIGWTFHGHDAVGAAMVPGIFKNMRLPLDHKLKYVQKMVRLHLRPIALTQEEITDSALRRLLFEAGEDLEDLLLLCEADITSKNPEKVKKYLNNYERVRQLLNDLEGRDRIRNWQPPVDGIEIMKVFGIGPGREVGIIKTAIREAILEGQIPNERKAAVTLMLEQGRELGLYPIEDELLRMQTPVEDVNSSK
ncbi:MAG: HD domain-containing protein [Saprospiraceae bacterium]|nr:HD domain-containing protein [Saprospiraceae bacterium]